MHNAACGGEGRPAGAPLDPKAQAALDYRGSFTGRQTNPLYDVRTADVWLIVDPQRLPGILDALARQNFITVTGLTLEAADPYEALQEGYFFGSGTVAELHLTLETVWLREWTSPFMPRSVKQALGVADLPPAGTGT